LAFDFHPLVVPSRVVKPLLYGVRRLGDGEIGGKRHKTKGKCETTVQTSVHGKSLRVMSEDAVQGTHLTE
jgi:hypothetical protein